MINGDAFAVYRELSVGVTKPEPETLASLRYHLLDVANLEEGFHLVKYQNLFREVLAEITARRKLPILVGGSGLYTSSVLNGYQPPEIEVSEEVKAQSRRLSLESALRRLKDLDPDAWQRIDRANPRRVSRALELALAHGGPVPIPKSCPRSPSRTLRLYLLPERSQLHFRISRRTEEMWEAWVEEVFELEKKGFADRVARRKPLGYDAVLAYLQGWITADQAQAVIVQKTVALSKRQSTWIKKELRSGLGFGLTLESPQDWRELPDKSLKILDDFLTETK